MGLNLRNVVNFREVIYGLVLNSFSRYVTKAKKGLSLYFHGNRNLVLAYHYAARLFNFLERHSWIAQNPEREIGSKLIKH